MRSITSREKATTAACTKEMQNLEAEEVGVFISQGLDKAFFKVPPTPDNKEKVGKFVDFEEYKTRFTEDIKNISDAQKKRLLAMTPQTK